MTLHTRLGTFAGHLYRVGITLTAHWGQPLAIEGTFLFCEEWTGPTVLGFHGFLERIRFAIDPNYERVGGNLFCGGGLNGRGLNLTDLEDLSGLRTVTTVPHYQMPPQLS